jgi:hypothetical protein
VPQPTEHTRAGWHWLEARSGDQSQCSQRASSSCGVDWVSRAAQSTPHSDHNRQRVNVTVAHRVAHFTIRTTASASVSRAHVGLDAGADPHSTRTWRSKSGASGRPRRPRLNGGDRGTLTYMLALLTAARVMHLLGFSGGLLPRTSTYYVSRVSSSRTALLVRTAGFYSSMGVMAGMGAWTASAPARGDKRHVRRRGPRVRRGARELVYNFTPTGTRTLAPAQEPAPAPAPAPAPSRAHHPLPSALRLHAVRHARGHHHARARLRALARAVTSQLAHSPASRAWHRARTCHDAHVHVWHCKLCFLLANQHVLTYDCQYQRGRLVPRAGPGRARARARARPARCARRPRRPQPCT